MSVAASTLSHMPKSRGRKTAHRATGRSRGNPAAVSTARSRTYDVGRLRIAPERIAGLLIDENLAPDLMVELLLPMRWIYDAEGSTANRCVDATTTLRHTYDYFGIEAHVRPVDLVVSDQNTGQMVQYGRPDPRWDDDVFSGHCVLHLPGSNRLIDPTVEQYPEVLVQHLVAFDQPGVRTVQQPHSDRLRAVQADHDPQVGVLDGGPALRDAVRQHAHPHLVVPVVGERPGRDLFDAARCRVEEGLGVVDVHHTLGDRHLDPVSDRQSPLRRVRVEPPQRRRLLVPVGEHRQQAGVLVLDLGIWPRPAHDHRAGGQLDHLRIGRRARDHDDVAAVDRQRRIVQPEFVAGRLVARRDHHRAAADAAAITTTGSRCHRMRHRGTRIPDHQSPPSSSAL